MNKKLYDSNSTMYVLGALLRQPTLIHDNKYILTESDFDGLHKIIFGVIYNLSVEGLVKIKPADVDLYLKQYTAQYQAFMKDSGLDYLQNIYGIVDATFEQSQFDYYYERVKKFTILRDLDSNGLDITGFYNPEADFTKMDAENKKLNDIAIGDIFDRVRQKVAIIEDKNISKSNLKAITAEFGLTQLVADLKKNPEVGFPLDGEILNFAARGARLGKFYLFSAPTGHGKALPNSTLIPTFYNGEKLVSEIKKGDYLIDRLGKPTEVLEVFPQGVMDNYRITFKDGREALCNDEHIWSVWNYRKNGFTDYTLKELIKKIDKKGYKDNDGGFRYAVPLNSPIDFGERKFKIEPYTLGALLGDGSFRSQEKNDTLYISSDTDEIPREIAKLNNWEHYKTKSNNYSHYFKKDNKNIHIYEFLESYPDLINAYSENKYIPEEFFRGSVEQRFSLLQGLLDTDGGIRPIKGQIKFDTISITLAQDIIKLVRSLGMIATLKRDKRPEKYKKTGVCYVIYIQTNQKSRSFRLQRKRDIGLEWENSTRRKTHYNANPIINITKLNKQEEMTCYLVDNEEHLFLMNDYIVTHNTRFLVGNACSLSLPYIDDGKIVVKENLCPVLFVATEMEPDEIQTLILAYVSGVDEDRLLTNTCTDEDDRLIAVAIKIIEQYKDNFKIEKISDPSISGLRSKLTKYILNDKYYHIFYDYIFTSPALNLEFARTGLREDVVLMMLSNTLKEMASDYNVFIFSGTQVSRGWEKAQFRNENFLAGAKAVGDKIDFGMIATKLFPDDLEKIIPVLEADGIFEVPNLVMDIYKNRRGRITNAKLYRVFDYGTCRSKDLMLTDTNFNKWQMGLGRIEYKQDLLDLTVESTKVGDKNE